MMSLSSSIVCVIGWRWPSRKRRARQADVELLAGRAGAGVLEPLAGGGEGGIDRGFDFVESFAGGRLIGRRDGAESLLSRFQAATFYAEKIDARRFEGAGIGRGGEGAGRLLLPDCRARPERRQAT